MKKKTILVAGGILFVFLSVFIYSCKKAYDEELTESVPNNLLEAAQDWHAQQTKTEKTLSNGKKAYVLPPQWKEARLHQSQNGTEIITPSPNYPLGLSSKMDVIRKFVFKVDGEKVTEGNIIEIYELAKDMKGKKATLFEKYRDGNMGDFTGSVIIYDVNYKYIKSEAYMNGVKLEGVVPRLIHSNKQQTSSKTGSGKPTTLDTDCYDVSVWWWTPWAEDPRYNEYHYHLFELCITYGLPESGEVGGPPENWPPIEPYTGGGGGGGGGGTCSTVLGKNSVKCTLPPPFNITITTDPCLQAVSINANSTNPAINNTKTALVTKISTSPSKEYGANLNLSSLPIGSGPYTYKTPSLTEGSGYNSSTHTSTWHPNPTWNVVDGFTVGFMHDHTSGYGPSPADVINIFLPLYQVDALRHAGQTEKDFYKNNVTVTTVLNDVSYVVSIKDWSAMETIYNTYIANSYAFNSDYAQKVLDYQNDHNEYTAANASVFALMAMFPNAINVYRDNGTGYQPLKIENPTTTPTVALINCP